VATVTRRAEDPTTEVEGADQVRVVEVPGRDPQRPAGKRFGSLVHELLARAPLDSDPTAVAELARSLGRVFGASEEEIEAAARTASNALTHDLFDEARRAELCRRELPLVHRLDDGSLLEGVPDLVLRAVTGGPRWTVVDFKTDLRMDIAQDVYRRQVALYARALRAVTGAPAQGILFYI
jgi:ATP-dependent exoDNAse (exonuclease V) beta subunit